MRRLLPLASALLLACSPKPAPSMTRLDLADLVKLKVYGQDRSGLRELWPGAVLHSGDKLSLAIEVSTPSHLYVALRSPGDAWTLLTPSTAAPPPVAVPQHQTHLPGSGSWFQLDDARGEENLYLVASRTPLPPAEVLPIARRLQDRVLFDREPPPTVPDKRRGPWLQATLDSEGVAVLRFRYRHE